METIFKANDTVSTEALAKINAFALTPLTAEQVFTFKLAACDTRVDRDLEQFTPECLRALAPLFIGKTVLFDHAWSARAQTARIYDAEVEEADGVSRLIEHCYMLRSEEMQGVIDAINAGILREVSVSCTTRKRTCSICGGDYWDCAHLRGEHYGGHLCTVMLSDPEDAFETSFVAVPAQRDAGVTKSRGARITPSPNEKGAGVTLAPSDREKEADAKRDLIAKQRAARLALRKKIIKL